MKTDPLPLPSLSDRLMGIRSSRTHIHHCDPHDEAAALRDLLASAAAEIAGLRSAMEYRAVIEQAKGMVMLQRGCDADVAFDLLREASMRTNTKLRDLAATMVASCDKQPPTPATLERRPPWMPVA